MSKKSKAFDRSKYSLWIDPNEVTPYERNAKVHTDKQIRNIVNSIKRFGWQQDTVITADKVLVIGHGRRLAAIKLGCEMPYHVIDKTADELTDEDIRELRIADNQTNAETGLDFDLLGAEIEDLDFDGFDFDFLNDFDGGADFFESRERNDTSRQDGNDEYNEFLDKFEPKKTTDDCYTPDVVYEAVADWVSAEYGLKKENFVRPFYPGGDYQTYKYKAEAVVVDNPPFSILAEIISWYSEHGVRFFLFAPSLTLFSSSSSSCCCLPCGVDITYENGATVPTSFVTNLEGNRVRVIPELYRTVDAANDKNLEATRRTLPKYKYPDYVLTAAMCNYICSHDTALTITHEDSQHVRFLDSQKEYGNKAIFGSGYLLSEKAAAEKAAAEKAAAEKAAAEKAAAEKAAAHVWELSDREWQIIKSLGKRKNESGD